MSELLVFQLRFEPNISLGCYCQSSPFTSELCLREWVNIALWETWQGLCELVSKPYNCMKCLLCHRLQSTMIWLQSGAMLQQCTTLVSSMFMGGVDFLWTATVQDSCLLQQLNWGRQMHRKPFQWFLLPAAKSPQVTACLCNHVWSYQSETFESVLLVTTLYLFL